MGLSARLLRLIVKPDKVNASGTTLIPYSHPVISFSPIWTLLISPSRGLTLTPDSHPVISFSPIWTSIAPSSMMPLYFMSDMMLFDITMFRLDPVNVSPHTFMPHVWSLAEEPTGSPGFFMSVMVFPEMTTFFDVPTLMPVVANVLGVPVSLLTCFTMLFRIFTFSGIGV
ncbi:hypothetical protein ES703_100904 [subsurface metagenome]